MLLQMLQMRSSECVVKITVATLLLLFMCGDLQHVD